MKFGDSVLVTGYILRVRNNSERVWEIHNYFQPKEAIFLGKRTLWNGKWIFCDPGYEFIQEKPLKAACICIKGKKPQNVLLEQVIELY